MNFLIRATASEILKNYKFLVFSILLICFSYLPFFSELSLSIDDELGAFRANGEAWIHQGRWFSAALETVFSDQPILVGFPYVIFALFASIAFLLMFLSFDIKIDWRVYVSYPLLVLVPTWYLILEFESNVIPLSFGLLLTSASFVTTSWVDTLESNSEVLVSRLTSVVFLSCAIACYQSLIFFYLALVIARFLLSEDVKIMSLAKTQAVTVFCGFGFYLVTDRIVRLIFPGSSSYFDSLFSIELLVSNPLASIKRVLEFSGVFYGYDSRFFGIENIFIGPMLLVAVFAALTKAWSIQKTVALAALLLLPFALALTSAALPLRAFTSVGFVIWFVVYLGLRNPKRPLAALLVMLTVLSTTILSRNQAEYFAASEINRQFDVNLASDVFSRLETCDPLSDKLIIDTFGTANAQIPFRTPLGSAANGSFFSWDNGNLGRVVAFMNLLGFSKVSGADVDVRNLNEPEFQDMPSWPSTGSVACHEGTNLVKLGPVSDSFHQSN